MRMVGSESVPQQVERVIERTHEVQVELLRLHRAMLGDKELAVCTPRLESEVHDAVPTVNLPDRPTLSVKEAARLLRVSRDVVYDGVQSGEIPALRLGRRLLIPRAALVRMLGGRQVDRPAQD